MPFWNEQIFWAERTNITDFYYDICMQLTLQTSIFRGWVTYHKETCYLYNLWYGLSKNCKIVVSKKKFAFFTWPRAFKVEWDIIILHRLAGYKALLDISSDVITVSDKKLEDDQDFKQLLNGTNCSRELRTLYYCLFGLHFRFLQQFQFLIS